MRSLLLLALGGITGAIVTVMLLSLDTSSDPHPEDDPGGGNARISLDQDALAAIVKAEVAKANPSWAHASVAVQVRPNGLVDVAVATGTAPVSVVLDLALDPEVVNGKLAIVLTEARVGELPAPDQVRHLIEAALVHQLETLAAGSIYRLTAITTTDGRLTLEIEI